MAAEQTTPPPAAGPQREWLTASRWIMLMLILSTVTWRSSSIYGGGLDVVVAAKALLGLLVIALAWAARISTPQSRPMGTAFVWLLLAYVTMSTFGAWSVGELAVSGVLSTRLLLVGTTVILLVKTFPGEQLINDFTAGMALVALTAAVTGIPSFSADGRLGGGIPGMHSNELSLLCALAAIGGIHRVFINRATAAGLLVLGALLVALVATGSRTALLAVFLASLVMLLQAKRLNPLVTVLVLACIPATLFVMVGTGAAEAFFDRQGEGDISTLNSRSIVWSAALDYPPTEWARWLGNGLGTKEIPVLGQYWDTQVFDSSWVSALVQAGWLGALLLLIWSICVVVMTFRMRGPSRMLAHGLLAALLSRSIVESGLMDSSPAFLTLALISFIADRGPVVPTLGRPSVDPSATQGAIRSTTSHTRAP